MTDEQKRRLAELEELTAQRLRAMPPHLLAALEADLACLPELYLPADLSAEQRAKLERIVQEVRCGPWQ